MFPEWLLKAIPWIAIIFALVFGCWHILKLLLPALFGEGEE